MPDITLTPLCLRQQTFTKRECLLPHFDSNTKTSPSTTVISLDGFEPVHIQSRYYENHFLQPSLSMPQDLDIDFVDGTTQT